MKLSIWLTESLKICEFDFFLKVVDFQYYNTFNKYLILESPFGFDAKKYMMSRTQVCHLKIWIEETLTWFKARRVIIDNITEILKTGNNSSIKWEDALMLLRTVLRKSWTYQVLPFIVNQDTSPIGNKIPYREFY